MPQAAHLGRHRASVRLSLSARCCLADPGLPRRLADCRAFLCLPQHEGDLVSGAHAAPLEPRSPSIPELQLLHCLCPFPSPLLNWRVPARHGPENRQQVSGSPAKECLESGEGLLDRTEVRGVGQTTEQARAVRLNDFADAAIRRPRAGCGSGRYRQSRRPRRPPGARAQAAARRVEPAGRPARLQVPPP